VLKILVRALCVVALVAADCPAFHAAIDDAIACVPFLVPTSTVSHYRTLPGPSTRAPVRWVRSYLDLLGGPVMAWTWGTSCRRRPSQPRARHPAGACRWSEGPHAQVGRQARHKQKRRWKLRMLSLTLADLGSVCERVLHAMPDMRWNFDTVSAWPRHESNLMRPYFAPHRGNGVAEGGDGFGIPRGGSDLELA